MPAALAVGLPVASDAFVAFVAAVVPVALAVFVVFVAVFAVVSGDFVVFMADFVAFVVVFVRVCAVVLVGVLDATERLVPRFAVLLDAETLCSSTEIALSSAPSEVSRAVSLLTDILVLSGAFSLAATSCV